MTSLVNTISKGKRLSTIVRSYKLLKDVTIEYFENEKMNLTFCKGTDPDNKLTDSVLVRIQPDFTEAKYVSLINIKISEKGERANEAKEITKAEFQALLKMEDSSEDVI